MTRLILCALAFGALLVASQVHASVDSTPINTHPYRELVPPAEVVVAAAGGPGVILAENIKSTIVVEYTGGGPCGSPGPADASSSGRSDPASDERGSWVTIGAVGAVFCVLTVAGVVLVRRSRV